VARANVVPLEVAHRITSDGGPPAVQLYRFVRADTIALCTLPFDINEVHRIAARDPAEFAPYWKERDELERLLAKIIRRGIAEGELRKVDPRLTALTILSNDEGVQNWFRLGRRWSPEAAGASLAELVVGGLLVDPAHLSLVAKGADALDVDAS